MFADFVNFFRGLFLSLPINVFDLTLLILFALYIFEDISFGLIASGISLVSTISSFFIGVAFYPYLSHFLSELFSLPKGVSDAIAFLIVASLSYLVISFALSILRKKYVSINFPKTIDKIGGAIFGSISFFFIVSFAVSLLLSFPTSAVIKNTVKNSYSAHFFSSNTQGIDRAVRKVFGGAIEDTINFLTVKPGSNESVSLNFKTTSFKQDGEAEGEMLISINREREKRGLAPLETNLLAREVAIAHAKDMLRRGYFSHYSPEGLSPFDRMAQANIVYQFAGENLAFAPDVQIAMDGLMKSPGHRENILNTNFGKVGIGVIDTGVYGKMFVQEFTD